MPDPTVRTEGIEFGPKIGKTSYMRVDIRKFVGGNTSFRALANSILVNPQMLLTAICAPTASKLGTLNANAVRAIARISDPSRARASIIAGAHNPSSNDAIFPKYEDAYLGLVIPMELKENVSLVVTVPVSDAFKKAFDREKQLKVLRPQFDILTKKLTVLKGKADRLELMTKFVREEGTRNVRQIAVMDAIIVVADMMVDEKKNDSDVFQKNASQKMKQFRDALDAYKKRANVALVQRPEAFVSDPSFIADRDRLPAEILDLLKANDFVAAVRDASKNPHLVPPELWDRLHSVLMQVALLLCAASPDKGGRDFAVEFMEQHALPMIHALIKDDIPSLDDIVSKAKDAELRAAIKSDWVKLVPPGNGVSVYELLAAAAVVALGTASNMEGPQSLAVAVMAGVAPAMIERSVLSLGSGKPLAAVIYRLICRSGNLTRANRVDLLVLLDERDMKTFAAKARGPITNTMFKGAAIRGVVALLAMAVFAVVVTRDEELSLKRVSDLVAAGGVALLGLAQSLSGLEAAVLAKAVGRVTLRAVAGIIVVASCISAAQGLGDSKEAGNKFAYYEGWVVIGSGVLSVAGWLLFTGAATSWAGVGEVLMAVGAILGAGVTVFSLIRGLLMDGTEKFIKGSMHHLARGLPKDPDSVPGPIAVASGKEASLGTDFAALVSQADGLVYWALPPTRAPSLRKLGFSEEAVKAILEL